MVKLLNHTKNRTPSHVLSNNGLCQHKRDVLQVLVLAVNSDWFGVHALENGK